MGGARQQVQADHRGAVDAVVSASLWTGWHTIGLSAEGSEFAAAKVMAVDRDDELGIVY